MNKPKRGSFDRVIVWIKQKLELLEGENQLYGTDDFMSWINEYRSAINVLEAAGRVDKKTAIAVLSVLEGEASPMAKNVYESAKGIRALLETLPDGGKP